MSGELPPELRQELTRLQTALQKLQMIESQLQQVIMQQKETEFTLNEVKKLKDDVEMFRMVGSIMFKTTKEEVVKKLEEELELLELRVKTLRNQRERAAKEVQEIRDRIKTEFGDIIQ